MLESSVCYRGDRFIRSGTIRLDHDRSAFALGGVEKRSELFEADFLVTKINRRDCAARDADDLLVSCGASVKRENGSETLKFPAEE